ncbi:MAG: glycosyltransferase [Prevotella sp.]|nr:glycosyltransferase [Prevotella sp.]
MPYQQDHQKKLISFIIPAYNVPVDMLRACIESIAQLSLRPFEREIIVVDDGSDESPLAALGTMADEIVYIRQKNRGVAVARNMGLKMAEGEFIQFIDADDILLRTPYEHVIDLVRYGKADMVMFDYCEKPDQKINYRDDGPMAGATLMRQHNIHGAVWSFLFHRSMLGSLRFTPGIAYGEDEEFTPQLLLRAERVITTTARAYCYRQRPTSAINRTDMRSRLQRLHDAKDVLVSLHKKSSTLPPEERAAMQRRTAQLTMDYIYNVMVLTQSRHYLDRQLTDLGKIGLFPLPDRDYTQKYKWFRRMTNTSIGRTVLLRSLPLLR